MQNDSNIILQIKSIFSLLISLRVCLFFKLIKMHSKGVSVMNEYIGCQHETSSYTTTVVQQ